jgi:hypothetical protein
MRPSLDWAATEARARQMTSAELHYAHRDCCKAAEALSGAEVIGKDEGYYRDEASVYWAEITRRQTKSKLIDALGGPERPNWYRGPK